MREVLFAFVMPHFCPLIADDTGLIFKEKRSGEWLPAAMLRYSSIESADFHGSNVEIKMKNGKMHKAAVLQKKQLLDILSGKNILCVDHGFLPF